MGKKDSRQQEEAFLKALCGKNIPVLTLDNKWYRLLDEVGRNRVKRLEEELNALLKRQGKLNTEVKNIRRLKKKLMNEIVSTVDEEALSGAGKTEQKLKENKRLIEECNEKLGVCKDELLELPGRIEQTNLELMLKTMECCYQMMHRNAEEIRTTEEWVQEVRTQLKKRLIRKQEAEQQNQEIYSYMHDVFGAEILDLFDMN